MILVLSHCAIAHDRDQDLDTISDDTRNRIIPQFSKEKWVIMLVSEGSRSQYG